jgi:hypothetical protein
MQMFVSFRKGIIFLLFVLGLSTAAFVLAANPPEPTYDTATVDGNESEWSLANDFFADMYRAGDPTKKVESKLYLRYGCFDRNDVCTRAHCGRHAARSHTCPC